MNRVFVRAKSTTASLLPPRVSALAELGRLQSAHPQAHPELFNNMKNFYARIPKGEKPPSVATTAWGRYYDHYFKKDSFVPFLHLFAVIVPTGYYLTYYKGGHYHPTTEFH
ncbi:hypothetical protein HK100_005395 [Physocladia obscura]|uniref:Uncharacterized protein n=1 Tax=Physocladia obscura TaxID=109957 RepID=A0AAD5XDA4_9FUNG|nr:hypothetical protein HK100_005395 [Physocladia obscura]